MKTEKKKQRGNFLYKRMKLKIKNSEKTLILTLGTSSHRKSLCLNGVILSSTPQILCMQSHLFPDLLDVGGGRVP